METEVIDILDREYPDDLPETPMDLGASLEEQRRSAYRRTADPLYLKWQRGEATQQEWLDAVQAVRDAIPYPEDQPG
jgi:hypothetical protein